MKPKTMILLGLAITCGLGASYMTSRLLAERQTPDEPERVEYLVAKQHLSAHTPLAKPEELFELKSVPKQDEPQDAIRDFDVLRGKKLKTSRGPGDHITMANLYDKGGIDVPPGHQAIGVPVNLVTTSFGLATLPGSRVDLHLTIRGNDVSSIRTVVLLENVLVLAADLRLTREGEIAAPAQVVTFALKQPDIMKANVAMDMGTIRLIMRNHDQKELAKVTSITGSDILGEKKKEPVEIAQAEQPKPVTPPVVKDTKPDPTPDPEPEKPKFTKHHYDVVNGSKTGERAVERVYYYRSVEDGRILSASEYEDAVGAAPAAPSAKADPKKGGGQREF